MKKLVCEMCGNTDITKKDGLYECQFCGAKYTVEEAKKMMVEGTVEVKGDVQIKNAAQLDNLLSLAKSSYGAKNYAQAENFCNQVIAMDGSNYDAWKLKGEAINYQITVENQRILEVYDCIMTSYRVLDDEGKAKHRDGILSSLRTCLEGEIDFWLNQFEAQRPSNSMLNNVKKTFIDCTNKILASYMELGCSEEEAEEHKRNIKNHFVLKANSICVSSWKNKVYYNYYRGGFTESYHPDDEVFDTYLREGDCLISLLQFTEDYFEDISDESKIAIFKNISYFETTLCDAKSYKRMVETTRNGLGIVTNGRYFWKQDSTLSASAKAARNNTAATYQEKIRKLKIKIGKSSPEKRAKLEQEYTNKINSINLVAKTIGFVIPLVLLIASIVVLIMFLSVLSPAISGALIGVIVFCLIWGIIMLSKLTTASSNKKDLIEEFEKFRKSMEK